MYTDYQHQIKLAQQWRAEHPEYPNGLVIVFGDTITGWRDRLRDPQDFEPNVTAIDENGNCWQAVGGDAYNGAKRWQAIVPKRVAEQPLTKMVSINAIRSPKLPSIDPASLTQAAHAFIALNGELPSPIAVKRDGMRDDMPQYQLINPTAHSLFTLAVAQHAKTLAPLCDCITAFVLETEAQEHTYQQALKLFECIKKAENCKTISA